MTVWVESAVEVAVRDPATVIWYVLLSVSTFSCSMVLSYDAVKLAPAKSVRKLKFVWKKRSCSS